MCLIREGEIQKMQFAMTSHKNLQAIKSAHASIKITPTSIPFSEKWKVVLFRFK